MRSLLFISVLTVALSSCSNKMLTQGNTNEVYATSIDIKAEPMIGSQPSAYIITENTAPQYQSPQDSTPVYKNTTPLYSNYSTGVYYSPYSNYQNGCGCCGTNTYGMYWGNPYYSSFGYPYSPFGTGYNPYMNYNIYNPYSYGNYGYGSGIGSSNFNWFKYYGGSNNNRNNNPGIKRVRGNTDDQKIGLNAGNTINGMSSRGAQPASSGNPQGTQTQPTSIYNNTPYNNNQTQTQPNISYQSNTDQQNSSTTPIIYTTPTNQSSNYTSPNVNPNYSQPYNQTNTAPAANTGSSYQPPTYKKTTQEDVPTFNNSGYSSQPANNYQYQSAPASNQSYQNNSRPYNAPAASPNYNNQPANYNNSQTPSRSNPSAPTSPSNGGGGRTMSRPR